MKGYSFPCFLLEVLKTSVKYLSIYSTKAEDVGCTAYFVSISRIELFAIESRGTSRRMEGEAAVPPTPNAIITFRR